MGFFRHTTISVTAAVGCALLAYTRSQGAGPAGGFAVPVTVAKVQQKNVQLEEANAELRQANDLKKAFIKVASHELRTPLTIVMGLSDLARRTPGVGEPLGHWMERIYAGSLRLNERIDLMIKLLLADRFERPLARRPVDLAGLLRGAAAEVGTFIEQRNQTLTVDAPADLGTLAVEEDKLRDSVFQLLINAVKFTPDGGAIRLSARRLADGGVAIQVADTGVGIPPEMLTSVFDLFTQVDRPGGRGPGGLGVGLALVRRLVEMHGGRVEVASGGPNQGSEFVVCLPCLPEAPPADAAGSDLKQITGLYVMEGEKG